MALICNTDTYDSFYTLLSKVHAIAIVNKENLDFIHSCKGQQVIWKYSLKIEKKNTKPNQRSNHNQKNSTSNDQNYSEDKLLILSKNKHTMPVNTLIEAWKYKGDSLTAEIIAFGHFIDIELTKFDDLVRLNDDYMSLYEKYSRVLNDEPESIAAVYGLLKNLEKVHVAIGEVHVKVLDARDPLEDDLIYQRIKALSHDFAALKEEMFKLDIVVYDQDDDDDDILEFENVESLSCKMTMKLTANAIIQDIKCFSIDDRQYIACASHNGSITVWDLSSQTISSTLTGHTNIVFTLAVYKQEGIQMLASGSLDTTIKLWNLSNGSLVATLRDHTEYIHSLSTYKNDGKVYLVSGSKDKTIKIWDIENDAALITTLEGHTSSVMFIKTYKFHGIPHLASIDYDGKKIKIWNLSAHTLMKTLDTNIRFIISLAVTNQNNKIIIACGCRNGSVKIYDLENNTFTLLSSNGGKIRGLEFICQSNQLCLLGMQYDGSLECWNMADRSILSKFDFERGRFLLTCEIGGKSCICFAKGGDYGHRNIWNKCILVEIYSNQS